MKSIITTINEAKRLSAYSDVELCCEFWDEWSGLRNGRGGTSGNSRAQRLEEEINKRFAFKDYFAMCWFVDLDEYLRKELNISDSRPTYANIMADAKKLCEPAHKFIRDNIDAIKNSAVKDKLK